MNKPDHTAGGTRFLLTDIPSPLGRVFLLAEGELLVYSGFSHPMGTGVRLPSILRKQLRTARIDELKELDGDSLRALRIPADSSAVLVLQSAAVQITEYFAGRRRNFTLDLGLYGTIFQKAVWKRLLDLPYGATLSYGELAAETGHPRSVRATGTAVGMNPLSVIVPCHRVLPASGGIGNYGGGRDRKAQLLEIEGAVQLS